MHLKKNFDQKFFLNIFYYGVKIRKLNSSKVMFLTSRYAVAT